jgi:division/cell wall cluster transcriptional repressor MraZ
LALFSLTKVHNCSLLGTERASASKVSKIGQPYLGFKPYAVDPKYRFAVPPAWRPATGEVLFLLYSRTHEMPMLKVLTQAGYDERVEIVNNSDRDEATKRQLLGSLAMLCREVSINEQGKLLIPKDLSEKAEIKPDSEIMLVGRHGHFEIWNKLHFEHSQEIEMNQKDELGIL